MDAARKTEIRRILAAQILMRENPVRVARSRSWISYVARPAVAAFFLLVLVGGGTSLAAEGSVPGDVLYPVKIRVTEPLRAVLVVSSPEARALWDVERASRRLEELAVVESREVDSSAPDLETKTKLEERFVQHAEQAREELDAIRVRDPLLAADIASRFEIELLARQKRITALRVSRSVGISPEDEKEDNAGQGLSVTISGASATAAPSTLRTAEEQELSPKALTRELDAVRETREEIEQGIMSSVPRGSAENRIEDLSRRIEKFERTSSEGKQNASPVAQDAAEKKVKESRELLRDAREALERGSTEDASKSMLQGARELEKARVNILFNEQVFNGEEGL